MYSALCVDFQALWQDLNRFVSNFLDSSLLFVFFRVAGIQILSSSIRIASRCIRIPSVQQLTQRIRMPSWASEFTFRHPSASSKHPNTLRLSSPDSISSVSECSFMHSNTPSSIWMHLFGIQIPYSRILKISSSKFKINYFQ